jgi:Fe-S oxidoreductase
MGERYTLEDHEAYRKEQDEKAAKEAEERREKMERESARRVWLADGGSAGDFEREWPKLRGEGRRRRVIDADHKAREMQRAHGPSRI